MGNLFRIIYSWFRPWFGENLYNYLQGWDCNSDLVNPNRFVTIGVITLIIVALIVLFYYVWPKRARFNLLVSWLITLLLGAGLFGFLFGFGYTYSLQRHMPAYVIYGTEQVESPVDEETGEPICDQCDCLTPVDGAQPQLENSNFVYFGFVNAIISMAVFFILSIIIKRFPFTANTGTQHTPWRSCRSLFK